jgi:hypothetical protein
VKWGEGSSDFAFGTSGAAQVTSSGRVPAPQYAGKRVIFVDKEAFVIPSPTSTTRPASSGRCGSTTSRSAGAHEGAPADGQYEWETLWLPSIVMVDVQLDHATRAALPSQRFEREVGWHFNKGEEYDTVEDFFSVAALIQAGR